MKIRPLSRDEVRSVDRIAIEEFGILGLVLMENAGRGAAKLIHSLAPTGKVAILCGKGNNAGDGYVIARHLDNWGRDVQILSIVPTRELSGDAEVNLSITASSGITITEVADRDLLVRQLSGASVIIDCLLGTGAKGVPRGFFADAIEIANLSAAKCIAIDIPSGMDCDSGEVATEAIRASDTITFVAPKLAMENPASGSHVGNVHVVEIGVPRKLLERFLS